MESEEEYLVIAGSDDGPTIGLYTKEQLVEWLEEMGAEAGEIKFIDGNEGIPEFEYWKPSEVLVIKGVIVEPRAEKVVVKYTVD